jgi:hypothetical protein
MSNNGGGGTAQEAGVRKRQTAVDRRAAAERITVALIPQASADLQRLQDGTGLSKTDIVNRAIHLYEFINSRLEAGRELIVRDPETGETQMVMFL